MRDMVIHWRAALGVLIAAGLIGGGIVKADPAGGKGVVGLKLIMIDKYLAANKAKLVFVSKDPTLGAIHKGVSSDPPNLTGMAEVFQASDPSNVAVFDLPETGSNQTGTWLVNKPTVAKYVNKDAPGGAGAVKVAVIKPQKLLKAVLKDLGDAGAKIDIYGAGDPAPSSVDVATQFTVTDGAVVRQHCGEFTACARKIIGGGSGAKVVCKTATPGASVTCPSSPSGAFLN